MLRIIIDVYNLRIYKMWMKGEKQKLKFWIVFNDCIEFDKTRTVRSNSNKNQPNWCHSHFTYSRKCHCNESSLGRMQKKASSLAKQIEMKTNPRHQECDKNNNLIQNKQKLSKRMNGVIWLEFKNSTEVRWSASYYYHITWLPWSFFSTANTIPSKLTSLRMCQPNVKHHCRLVWLVAA